MARSKKQSRAASASRSKHTTPASASTTSESTQVPKPWVEYVTVDRDDKSSGPTRGVLAGLDPNAILKSTQRSTEVLQDAADHRIEHNEGDDASETLEPPHATRGSRNGRAAVNYDQKLHPMDTTLRPRHAAKRLSGALHLPGREAYESDDVASEEGLSPATDCDSDDKPESSCSGRQRPSKHRIPDPGATRHSSRAEARKTVNYSTEIHPQDYALPFYGHNAELRNVLPIQSREPSKRTSVGESSIASYGYGMTHPRPRKKLRIHASSSSHHAMRRKRSREPEQDATSTDIEELANQAIRGSQAQPLSLADDDDDDEEEEEEEEENEIMHGEQYDHDADQSNLEEEIDHELDPEMEEVHRNLAAEADEEQQGSDFIDQFAVTTTRSFEDEVSPAPVVARTATKRTTMLRSKETANAIGYSTQFLSHYTAESGVPPATTEQADALPSTAPPSPLDPRAESSFVLERLVKQDFRRWQAEHPEIQNTSSPASEWDAEQMFGTEQSDGISCEIESILTD
ncbi:hypothetical protein LTR78_002312 [Recurvomyces mirabilis]|uniref:Uncharacterized protein n=1 Tax=Recurvomyces mirabilis TaxID=574656 RepID=A0AAE0WUM0_9PEZI|nr:hypothetical protein LTR78_002312 [Recurvomyces mirabilis]